MYTKRATIISPRSLAHLHKVCYLRQNPSDYFKIITFSTRNLSAKGLADFENPNFGNGRNPRNPNQAINENGYPLNTGIYPGGTYNGYNQSYNGGYGENYRYSSFGGQTGQNSGFGVVNPQNLNGVNAERPFNGGQSGNFNGYGNVQSSYNSYPPRENEYRQPSYGNGGFSNSCGQNGNFGSGYYGQNTGGFDQRSLGKNTNSQLEGNGNGNGNVQSSYSSYSPRPAETIQQNPNGFQHQQNYWPNSNGVYHVQDNPISETIPGVAPETSPPRDPLSELDGFCEEGKVKEAVELLKLLEEQKVSVDIERYIRLLQVCGEAAALEEANTVHEDLIRSHPVLSVRVYNKILEMYSRCGSMEDAYLVFRDMPERNLTTWDTMIRWLAWNGFGEEAIDLFTEGKRAGIKPDGQMFLGVFKACSVVGDFDEGMSHFESMRRDFGIEPTMEVYEGIVDMMGSLGYIDEALEFVEKMPLKPDVSVWESLMISCRVHGITDLGDRCAEIIELIKPSHLNDQSKAGLVPIDPTREKAKKPARSLQNPLEVRSRVHEYRAGDTSHPENDRIYANLRSLREHMKEVGYVPETRFVLHDIDQESKEEALLSHSERLAVAYSLLSTSARSPVRIIKNLRACGDCHTALKIISKIVGRELIIRDAKRFHHFKDGSCSCRDYW